MAQRRGPTSLARLFNRWLHAPESACQNRLSKFGLWGRGMRYERIGDLILLALDMQAVRGGLSVDDIAERYGVARRTAFRMKEAVVRCFPQTEEVPTDDKTKRWRIPRGTLDKLVAFSAEELAALGTAVRMMERNGMLAEAAEIDLVVAKLGALARPEVARRVEPDLEALLEAEGIAMRPGPKLKVSAEVVDGLRKRNKGMPKGQDFLPRQIGKGGQEPYNSPLRVPPRPSQLPRRLSRRAGEGGHL